MPFSDIILLKTKVRPYLGRGEGGRKNLREWSTSLRSCLTHRGEATTASMTTLCQQFREGRSFQGVDPVTGHTSTENSNLKLCENYPPSV
ncbi:hypothetical protein DPMN_127057 [Dreissena polymorpha]|uniref:Uncharacterized protein n=1 Tax=Dreissena polymorpha TaxID=45954 RepID=A0A9D4JW61_DREPO|nr:hypothetical protein DPMN_127057 [Dreissena polymorpha]